MTSVVVMIVRSDLVMVVMISFTRFIGVMMFFFVRGNDECCGNDTSVVVMIVCSDLVMVVMGASFVSVMSYCKSL